MSNLKIGYLDIPFRAISVTSNITHPDLFPYDNWIGGPKYTRSKAASNNTDTQLTCDMGLNNTATANFLYIANAKKLKSDSVTVALRRSSDGSSYSNEQSISMSGQTLYGPRSDDFITTFSTSSAYRYWQIRLTAGASTDFQCSKFFFGTYLDFSLDCDYEYTREVRNIDTERADSGAEYIANTDHPTYEFKLRWKGLTDAEITSFVTYIARYRNKSPIPLFTTSVHSILDNQRIIYAKLTSYEHQKVDKIPDYNRLTATFEEVA